MVSNYKKTKEAVLKSYEDFLPILASVKKDKETSYDKSLIQLEKHAENLKNDKFLLMIVGEAKSGKSTFINAYLGEEILPMDVKQCTSAIVEIRYGKKFILNVTYADDTVQKIEDSEEIKKFLVENAALDDDYRDIPVSVINIEILMHKKGDKIHEFEIKDLLKGIKNENIHNLPEDEYEKKVRKYIAKKHPIWNSIVKKIEIQYPFADKDMKGIEIVDTPGVNADGRVGDITNKYIEEANAVMFLKPLTGAALESTSFKNFLKSKSADRNKNAMFLLLSRAATETPDNIARLHDEALKIYPSIHQKQIIPIDSKAELFYNTIQEMTIEEIQSHVMGLAREKKLDAFIKAAWFDSLGNRDEFLKILKELSNFNVIDDALNIFAHKAQYLSMSEFLGRLLNVIDAITDKLEEDIDLYKQKAEDPIELGHKLNVIKSNLEEITRKINETVDDIAVKYSETGGLIEKKAETEIKKYEEEISKLSEESTSSMDELEKISFRKIDVFKEFEAELQKNIVAECDEALISLSDKSQIKYSTIKPDLTPEVIKKIKEDMKAEATETYTYTTGTTFKKTHQGSRFSQSKYFKVVRDNIKGRIDKIKNDAIKDLRRFVNNTTTQYSDELRKNANIKRAEYDEIQKKIQSAEEIQETIAELSEILASISPIKTIVEEIKGGIDRNVQ